MIVVMMHVAQDLVMMKMMKVCQAYRKDFVKHRTTQRQYV